MLSVQPLNVPADLRSLVDEIQWVTSKETDLRSFTTFGYPEATSELLIIKSGGLTLSYRNNDYHVSESCCFTFIEEPSRVVVSKEFSFFRVVFKPLGVMPLVSLTGLSPEQLILHPVIELSDFENTSLKSTLAQALAISNKEQVEALIKLGLSNTFGQDESTLSSLWRYPLSSFSTDHLCDLLCCTPRTLQRWFKNEMGITPKYFLRLLRFKHTLQYLGAPSPDHPIAVAQKLGYYDHNHLIKEVQNFTKTTPGKLSFDHYLPVQLPYL